MPIHRQACPFCAGELVLNDEERKASHSVPECESFARLNSAASRTFLEELDADGRPVRKRARA